MNLLEVLTRVKADTNLLCYPCIRGLEGLWDTTGEYLGWVESEQCYGRFTFYSDYDYEDDFDISTFYSAIPKEPRLLFTFWIIISKQDAKKETMFVRPAKQ